MNGTTTRNDPYTAVFWDASEVADIYMVQSASDPETRYRTAIARHPADRDHCTCPARVPCNHIDRARLRRQCDRVYTNSAVRYRTFDLDMLEAEDAALRERLADVDSWLVRAQYGALGDRIAEHMAQTAAA